MRDLVERGELTEEEAQAMMNGTTLRPPRMKEWMWPTPRARDYKDGSSVPPSRVKNPELATLGQKVVMEDQKMWPTPRASIGMNMSLSEKMATLRHKRYLETEMAYQIQKDNPHKTTAKLSPGFVEYLMGFPDGWTNPDISNEQLISMNTEQRD
jgi:site-specific DNA-cytosine methylase